MSICGGLIDLNRPAIEADYPYSQLRIYHAGLRDRRYENRTSLFRGPESYRSRLKQWPQNVREFGGKTDNEGLNFHGSIGKIRISADGRVEMLERYWKE